MNIHAIARSAEAKPITSRRVDIPSNTFTRALTARVLAKMADEPPATVSEAMWPSDHLTPMILERAASAPAMVGVAGWAAELAQRHIYDMAKALFPYSAGMALFQQGLMLTFDRAGSISVPGFASDWGGTGFIGGNLPIPVFQGLSSAATLSLYKLAGIALLTREMLEASNAEAMITDAIMRVLGRMLDAALFDTNPATASRPAGLRNGIAALTASTSTVPAQALYVDAGALADAVAPVASNQPVNYISGAGRRVKMRFQFINNLQPEVASELHATTAVGQDLLCVAPGAIVSAFESNPEVDVARNAGTLTMDDTNPPVAGTTGPAKSIFQTDSIAIKLRWPVSWALRDSRGVAWVTPTAW